MARIGHGYGSEWHLLRYMGRHRHRLDRAVARSCGASEVEWLDSPFSRDPRWRDAEGEGLDFLPASNPARQEWSHLWPQRGNVQNWDAVGRITVRGAEQWLLVEAKAHLGEVISTCGARSATSWQQIDGVFGVVKKDLRVPEEADWMQPYYQYCNRIAALHILSMYGTPAHLLFIYFTGDWQGASERKCPKTQAGWNRALEKLDRHIMLPRDHPLSGRVHKLFLEVVE